MATDLDIARKVKLISIKEMLEQLSISEDDFDFYGKYTGKIKLSILDKLSTQPNGKLILVTAMSPTNWFGTSIKTNWEEKYDCIA